MRSRLEADYAAWLDRNGRQWEYEPECFADADGQWLPDFRVHYGSGPVLTEVKPAGPLQKLIPASAAYVEHADAYLKRMTTAWSSQPGALLSLVFWQYGGPPYLTIFSVRQGSPWLATTDEGPELLWLGMGQYERLRDRDVILACRISKDRWQCSCGCEIQKGCIGHDEPCVHLRALGMLPAQSVAPRAG